MSVNVRVYLVLLALLAAACGGGAKPNPRDTADANDTGRRVQPSNQTEQELLSQVAALAAGSPHSVNGASVVADPAYHSASGRTCRALRITRGKSETTQRLACSDGGAWFFVPDVLGLNATPE